MATTRHLFSQLVFGNLISTAAALPHTAAAAAAVERQTQSNQLQQDDRDDDAAAAHFFVVVFSRDKEGVTIYYTKASPLTNGLLHNLAASIKASVCG